MAKKKERRFWAGVGFLVLVFVFGFGGAFMANYFCVELGGRCMYAGEEGAASSGEVVERVEQISYVEESALIDAVEKVSPAVVSVVVSKDLAVYRQEFNPFFGGGFGDFYFSVPEVDENGEQESVKQNVGGGSGFIVTNDGMVVTNRHVVSDEGAEYTVVLSDGTEYQGEVVAMDTVLDIAVMQMVDENGDKPSGMPVVELGSSDDLRIGQRVFAVGYALAEYANTVTSGVVSAKERDVVTNTERMSGLIQTDTAINLGNSGGPLVNLAGQVVGINTAVAGNAEGIGFVLPIDDVKPVLESVMKNGRIVRPYVGVLYQMITPSLVEQLNLDVMEGARLVEDVQNGVPAVAPDSPALEAGLKLGDVVTKINGEKLTVENDLRTVILKYQPGEEVTLTVWRDGEEIEKKVTLVESPLTKPDEE